jgi:hypothetical protein
MAHHCGFVSDTLRDSLKQFSEVHIKRTAFNNLLGVGFK